MKVKHLYWGLPVLLCAIILAACPNGNEEEEKKSGITTYLDLTREAVGIKICCYPITENGNSGAWLLSGSTLKDGDNAPGFWDYGWNGSSDDNASDWPEILKTPLGENFNGDECGKGHPTVFLDETVPESIRKQAHCFTLDLGEVTGSIVSFGMYPRTNEDEDELGDRWPIQFEVFYSDSEIGAIPGDEAASLGIFTWDTVPYPFAWRDVDLTENNNGTGISARYIHVRIYAEGRNGENSDWICPSFAGIRIGVKS
jgi:hypothetical protein